MADDELSQQDEKWDSIGEQLAQGLFPGVSADAITDVFANASPKMLVAALKFILGKLVPLSKFAGETLVTLEEPMLPIFAAFVAPIVANLFGTEAPAGAFDSRDGREGRGEAARAIVEAFMTSLAGDGAAQVEPSDEGAKRVASAAVHAALEGWFNELIPELLGRSIPWDWFHFDAFSGLSEEIIRALGVGRLVRRAFSPLVDATAATPMKWHVEKLYRTSLLAPSTVLRQFTRGRWDWSDVEEELARQGYSAERIDALLNEQMKFLSVSELRTFVQRGEWTNDQALQHLRDQGYDEQAAQNALRLEGLKRIEQLESGIATSAVAAYANRDIDAATFQSVLSSSIGPPVERALLTELGDARRALNVKHLSSAQAAACVRAEILNVLDYRDALVREGYDDFAVTALELLLRRELDDRKTIEQHRAELEASRAAEAARRDKERSAKAAEVEAASALHRRGSIADLRAAVVRGLIPMARLEEVLAASFDADTVQIYVDTVNDERQRYLAQQQAADAARQRAARRGLDVGQLESAVLNGVLTLDNFRSQLAFLKFAPADVDILANTLTATKAARDAALAQRRAAEAAAKVKHIDLTRLEDLVRRGHRTLAQYDATLQTLGFDDASRAAMRELLGLKIADDQKARDLRAGLSDAAPGAALTLDQMRRAVILGVKTIDDFETWLVDQKYTSDAVALLVAELAADVDSAEAARQKRLAAAAASGSASVPLARAARAARLGIITPAAYQQRLEAAGYTDDDIALEMDLLLTEIADVQAQRAKRETPPAPSTDRGLSLAQLEHAVKVGAATIDQYRARAVALGFDLAAVNTLTAILELELAALADAKSAHATIAATFAARGSSLTALDDQVRSGAMSLGAYQASLEDAGVTAADAALVAGLLAQQLAATEVTG